MKNTKKILALALVLVMALSLFAGCAQTNAGTTTGPQSTETYATGGETIAATDLFKEHVTLHYVFVDAKGVADYAEWDRIVDAVNEITEAKINATIEFEVVPLGDFASKMSAKYQANEPWDVTFSGAWNAFAPNAAAGAYAELSLDFLNTYAPNAMKLINQTAFEAVTVNGKIYGVPLQQIYVRTSAVRYDKDFMASIGADMSSITKLEDLEPVLQKMVETGTVNVAYANNIGEMYNLGSYFDFDYLVNYSTPGVVIDTDTSCTVVNQYATETFKNYAYLMKDWYDKGYFDDSLLVGGESGNENRMIDIDPAYKPGNEASQSATEDLNLGCVAIGDAVLTTSAINATTHVISANSQNPGRAMAFIDLLTSDAELLNLLVNGQEGVDWNWVNEDIKLIEKTDSGYPGAYAFLVGNTFLEYYTDAVAAANDYQGQIAEINMNAKGSPILGFSFDATNVANEIANCNAIIDEYLAPLMAGAVDDVDAAIAELNNQLELAGMQAILDEMQTQVNAWKAANG